jgi:hypothetical protein
VTFTAIVTEVLNRTRQSSSEATTRIGREVNDRNRRVTAAVGLPTSRRTQVSATTTPGSPDLSFTCEKILSVYELTSGNRRVLNERTFDEWRNANTWAPVSGQPWTYAINRMGASTVTIVLDPVPAAAITLWADCYGNLTDLTASDVPAWAQDFHDILVHGATADEWLQLNQDAHAARSEAMYEARLADLRMFIASSAYLAICQGGRGGLDRGAYWPGYTVGRWWGR